MTIILTRASIHYVLQVTDRLVTSKGAPFDSLANKNIVYCARNAIVSIGYTGHAFLGDVPTDQWIVEKLIGTTFDRGRKPPAFSLITRSQWLDIGRSLQILKEALDNAIWSDVRKEWRQDWIERSFDVCIHGWQWNAKGRYRPFLALVAKPGNSNTFELQYTPRHWYVGDKFAVIAAPSPNISESEHDSLTDSSQGKPPDEAERVLVESIRRISMRIPEVGPHCMSILLAPPSIARGRVRYIPANTTFAIVTTASSRRLVLAAFSPWLVASNVIVAPSVMSGAGWQVALGPYVVDIEAPTNPDGTVTVEGQERPTPPA